MGLTGVIRRWRQRPVLRCGGAHDIAHGLLEGHRRDPTAKLSLQEP